MTESFKDKILRQIEEENKAAREGTFEHYAKEEEKEFPETRTYVGREAEFPELETPKPFSNRKALEETAPIFQFADEVYNIPKEETAEIPTEVIQAQVDEEVPELSLREKLEKQAVASSPTTTFSRRSRKNRDVEADETVEEPSSNLTETAEIPSEEIADEVVEKRERKPKKEKPKRKTTAGKIIAVIVALLIVVILGLGWFGYNYVHAGLNPLNPQDKTQKTVNIPLGSGSKQIGDILQSNGIIKSGTVFQYYSKFQNYSDFKGGYYNLSPNMTLTQIADELSKGGSQTPQEPVLGKIAIPEGYTFDQIATAVTKNAKGEKTPFTADDFKKTAENASFIAKMQKEFPDLLGSLPTADSGVKIQLEGYLFPATYDYSKKTTTESLIESMLAAENETLKPYYAQIKSQNLTVNEVLALSALVEKEANNDDDRKMVAGVFFNRIANGMTLDSNSSILYAEGQLGAKTTLKQDATVDTNYDSPYNLYANTGFGPGPIDSPSLSSIKAVLNPATTDDLYFVADVKTGKVYFAQTLDEQNQNVQTYVNDELN